MQRGAVDDDDAGGTIEIQIVGNFDDGIRRQRDLFARAVVAARRRHSVADLQVGDPCADASCHARASVAARRWGPPGPPPRAPTCRSVTPAPTLSITPATSAAGENGNGGLIWYLPWIIRMSKKFSAAALMAITAWPGSATGSGTSVSTRSSGWQYCEQRMAFMDTPDFRTHKEGWMLLAGFEAGLQSDSEAWPYGAR